MERGETFSRRKKVVPRERWARVLLPRTRVFALHDSRRRRLVERSTKAAQPRELAKTYDPKHVEEKWYAYWEEKGYFQAEGGGDKTPFPSSSRRPT